MGEKNTIKNNVSYMGGEGTVNRPLYFLSQSCDRRNNFGIFLNLSIFPKLSTPCSNHCHHLKLSSVFEAEVWRHFTAIRSTACYRCYLRSLSPAGLLMAVAVT